MFTVLSTAQKVRLWFAAGCQALALLFIILILALPADNTYLLTDGSTGTMVPGQVITDSSLTGDSAALFVFQVAAVVLASITLYRFLKPKTTPAPGPVAAVQYQQLLSPLPPQQQPPQYPYPPASPPPYQNPYPPPYQPPPPSSPPWAGPRDQ